jgi:hypothetical protein
MKHRFLLHFLSHSIIIVEIARPSDPIADLIQRVAFWPRRRLLDGFVRMALGFLRCSLALRGQQNFDDIATR